ncbi:DUF3784 domain-containing protein [Dethiobacter alkaliphilus]|uniref:DUF3784 domain-containing protein n=1 Tax=Dethiobacter alkaliphilus TaxID=427926 RepID=UPI0022279402|nr:DUF3784 domain-containing protein [Dethiobacter alkaliphilus]MCW3490666.1 DUF3784 domain-containing protein [Dethiobacter alkaliphilus]
MWLYFALAAIFFLIGLAIHVFKWYFLIAGYNTMSKEQQAQVDTEALGRLIGYYSYANGFVLFGTGILYASGADIGIAPSIVFLVISTVYLIIKAQQYNGNTSETGGDLIPGARKQVKAPLAIIVVTLLGVAGLMYFSSQPTSASFLEEGLQIHGMYGQTYAWESIKEVRLIETLPTGLRRTNGSGLGPHLKGNFSSEEFGAKKLFVNRDNPPFIFLSNGEIVIFNLAEAEETKTAYERILEEINN